LKKRSWIMIALVMLVAAGCAGGGGMTAVAPTVNITGKWAGSWVATNPSLGSGVIEMTVTQTGSQYSGELLMTGTRPDPSGPTGGIVSGNEVRFTRPAGLSGSLMVQDDTMKGTLQATVAINATLTRQK
jgi:hypothetical protein